MRWLVDIGWESHDCNDCHVEMAAAGISRLEDHVSLGRQCIKVASLHCSYVLHPVPHLGKASAVKALCVSLMMCRARSLACA